jgi:glycosyltransferase involved in cell wall biosynthesis
VKVAFIIPARDKEKHVRRAMRSAFKQTYSNMEIVVSDQGSLDNTRKVIHEAAKEYTGPNKLTLLDCPITKYRGMPGLNQHLNWIVENVDADIFMCSAADDFSLPRRAELTVAAFEQHKPSMVATGMYFADEGTELGVKYGGESGYPTEDGWVKFEEVFPRYIGGSTTQAWTREFYEKIGGLDGVGSPDIIMPFIACLDKGMWYIQERLHTYCRIVGKENTGLQSVMDAMTTDAERLQIEEIIHFQVTCGLYACLGKMGKCELTTEAALHALTTQILDRNASWVNTRQKMTFDGVPPIAFKAV